MRIMSSLDAPFPLAPSHVVSILAHETDSRVTTEQEWAAPNKQTEKERKEKHQLDTKLAWERT